MKLSCIHCGQEFSITAEQLGGKGRCPHCHGEIQLPRSADQAEAEEELAGPSHWLENSVSALGSMFFNMLVVLIIALIPFGAPGLPGNTEEALIGEMPAEELSENTDEELSSDETVEKQDSTEELEDPLVDVDPPTTTTDSTAATDLIDDISFSAPGGANTSFDGSFGSGRGMGGGGDFEGLVGRLRRYGLDVVIAFDSTGSMSGEINQVKGKIDRIGTALMKLVPKTRIGVTTYRDEGDAYLVKGLPMTNDIQEVKAYLEGITAGGGGDLPEAVQEGLRWSMDNNQFRSRARKIILLFGDAPPHPQQKRLCLQLASDFSADGGVVSTVTCRQNDRMPDFVEIAQVGGGEAFLTRDERQIMTQLMVLVFGNKHRAKVLEAFKMLGE